MEQDDPDEEGENWEALAKTGYYAAHGAAGCIFLARDTQRFLIAKRSRSVEQPGTWGSWGGAMKRGEEPKATARREAHEETGYSGPVNMVPLYVYRDRTFSYSNFLAVVPRQFDPQLNWEAQSYVWCEFGDWPQPLHFGLQAIFADSQSMETIHKVLAQIGRRFRRDRT